MFPATVPDSVRVPNRPRLSRHGHVDVLAAEARPVGLALIPNTLEVNELWVSGPLAEEAKQRPHLDLMGLAQPLPFDAQGNLNQEKLFPHSVRGRRK